MFKIGLTGGIGSGKTTVCKIFEILGIPVYYSDDKAKELMQNDAVLISTLKQNFGENIYNKTNILDREALSAIVFKDKSALEKLNSIVHPVVLKNFDSWYLEKKSDYVILESAILFDTGINKLLDKIICVYAPIELRIMRINKRDGIPPAKAMERIKNQLHDYNILQLSDFVIINNEQESVINQVFSCHHDIISDYKSIR